MKLVPFTMKYNSNNAIAINADKVVAVFTMGTDTCIAVAAAGKNGPHNYLVTETFHEAVGKLA